MANLDVESAETGKPCPCSTDLQEFEHGPSLFLHASCSIVAADIAIAKASTL